jgi:hypothetical protein
MKITEQELTQLLSEIKEDCNLLINERNTDNEYTIEEKQWNEQHWRGVSIGAEVLFKNILNTIKYKKLVESN